MVTNLNPANVLTFLRFLIGILTAYSVYVTPRYAPILFILFVLMDVLDGYVARRFKCETALGRNLDFFVDGFIGWSVGLTLFIVGNVPKLYLVLVFIPSLIFALFVLKGIMFKKATFINSRWPKLNGIVFYLSLLMFMLNNQTSVSLAYFLLIYIYVSTIFYIKDIMRITAA